MFFLLLVSLIPIGIGTKYYVELQHNKRNHEQLKEKMQSVLVEIEHKLDRIYAAFYAGGYGVYVVIKECMNILGRPGGFPRPPHLPIDNKGRKRLTPLMSELGFVE